MPDSEARAYTPEEMRSKMLSHMKTLVKYWSNEKSDSYEACDGLAFSILTMFDGSTMSVPAMDIIPAPCEEDLEYHKERGENWFEPVVINDCMLHDLWHTHGRTGE
jgi:hypothetical protein